METLQYYIQVVASRFGQILLGALTLIVTGISFGFFAKIIFIGMRFGWNVIKY